jgi:hypothetical protein
MVRRVTVGRLVAAALSLAVATSSTSVAGAAEVKDTRKACCAAMHHDCGAAVITQKCCAPDESGTAALAPNTSQSRQRAIVAFSPVSQDPVGSTLARMAAVLHSSPLRSPRTPTYLSDSVFRI